MLLNVYKIHIKTKFAAKVANWSKESGKATCDLELQCNGLFKNCVMFIYKIGKPL